jgi:hypothetical protein
MQEISSLELVDHMLFWDLLRLDRGDGLMGGRIERPADRLDRYDMKSRQGSRQLLEGEIHALDKDVAASPLS